MDIKLHSRNLDINDGLRNQVNQKLSQIHRHLPGITDIRVELASEKTRSQQQRIIAQVTVDADGTIIRSEQRAQNINTAISLAVEALDRQIARYKNRSYRSERAKHHTSLRAQQAEEAALPDLADDTRQLDGGDLVRVKRFQMEPMSVEKAAFRMQMLGHSFFMFLNREDDRHNVLYQRDDGNYGLIQPEG